MIALLFAATCFAPIRATAAEGHVISVTGTGKVEARPDRVEMTGTVLGDGELASDAVKKFQENRRRALEALNTLKLEGMTVEGTGMMITSPSATQQQQQMFIGGNAAQQATGNVAVSESIVVTIDGIDSRKPEDVLETVMKVMDTGKDAGLTLGPRPMSIYEMQVSRGTPAAITTFRVHQIEQHRKKAYEMAMEDARKNAERLAALAGVKVGKVISIKEGIADMPADSRGVNYYMYAAMLGSSTRFESEYSSTSLKPISVSIALNVEFEID